MELLYTDQDYDCACFVTYAQSQNYLQEHFEN